MTRRAVLHHRADWAREAGWNGGWNGEAAGTGVSFIFTERAAPGLGPKLHRHAYDEVQIVRRGRALYEVDGEEILAEEGDILVIPAGVPHLVRTVDDQPHDVLSVHLTGKMAAEWIG